jgi:hypothetical protein
LFSAKAEILLLAQDVLALRFAAGKKLQRQAIVPTESQYEPE